MKLTSLNTSLFKLDGGAMFGVVPKSIWNKTNPADQNNMCTWAMRCLLIEEGSRLILVDTGIGNKQSDKFFGFNDLKNTMSLESCVNNAGYNIDEVTDVLLTHLHFDHVGGAVNKLDENKFETACKNATYWSNARHWKWATETNVREKNSFLKENIMPIQESGQLKFLEEGDKLTDNIDLVFVSGHTDAMMLPKIKTDKGTILYTADLVPSVGHLPIAYVMGYDTRPLLTLDEKEKILSEAVTNNYTLFFEHDSVNECCTLQNTERGIRAERTFNLSEGF
jgi:glyoxylase-like metal-dependent hydrolase (beta-lactamase superfamily II)